MPARSASQILTAKDECTFFFSSSLIIGLCNPLANSLLEIISFLIVLSKYFLSKKIVDC